MKLYTVHLPTHRSNPAEAAVLVPEGFSVWAMILEALWCVYHRLWWWAGVLVCVNVAIFQAEARELISWMNAGVLQMFVSVMVGFEACEWRRASLFARGYRAWGVVSGDSPTDAQRRFLDLYLADAVSPDLPFASGVMA